MNVIKDKNIQISEFDRDVLNMLAKRFVNAKIYYKPFINGDIPNILVLEENKGVILIDVSKIKLSEYTIKDKNIFVSKETQDEILSPIKKLTNYKNNMFKSHIDGLLEQKIKSKGMAFNIIKNVVIFQYETDGSIIKYFGSNYFEYTKLFSKNNFQEISLLRETEFFSTRIYTSFLKVLTQVFHKKEEGSPLNYTNKQKKLSISMPGQYKISGVAGAGKTYVLAKRAVNSYLRHTSNVLILTYNKSLKPYVAQKINEVQEDFDWRFFYINNYHAFITSIGNNLYMPKKIVDSLIETEQNFDVNLLEKYRHLLPKYESIFVDEVQDYETKWLRILKEYFLDEDGEFVVFGDEKQNVYDRKLDNAKKINTTIPARWNELKDSFRFNGKLVDLANGFQEKFLSNKYEISKIEKRNQLTFEFNENGKEHIEYIKFDQSSSIKELAYAINFMMVNDNLDPKDISIVGSKINFLKELDLVLRKELNQKTQTMFVKKEYQDIYDEKQKKEIEYFKKSNFDIDADAIKLSTIHSFKGYEAKTLIFILTEEDKNDEIIYTAFTRAKKNLYIINKGNQKYDEFFSTNTYLHKPKSVHEKVIEEVEKNIENSYDEATLESKKKELKDYKETNNPNALKSIINEMEKLRKELKKERMAKNHHKREHEKSKQEIEDAKKNFEEAEKKSKIKDIVVEATKKRNDELEKQRKKDNPKIQKAEIISSANKIEDMLIQCGADNYLDFMGKINFIEVDLGSDIVNRLHSIRRTRNNVAHKNEYKISGFKSFCDDCEKVMKALKSLKYNV